MLCLCFRTTPPPTQTTTTTMQKSAVIKSVSHPPHLEDDGNAAFQPLTRDLVFTSQAGFLSNVFLLTRPTPSLHSGEQGRFFSFTIPDLPARQAGF